MAITVTNPAPAVARPGRRLDAARAWLRHTDQPGWARPGLLAVALLAAVVFGWGAFHTASNDFYAADARSMSMSWKNFVYGSFDPAGSVTIDKLWGFLWPQALSVKIFGYHAWSLALPEAIEGVVTVLVLFRLTRRWTGRADAALLAAGIFTLTPIVASTFGHSGLEDNALTMLLVLASDAFVRAIDTGRLRTLLLSGFWVGMAFQTKMVQAWTVVPVFGLVYLCCGKHGLVKRIRHVLAAGAVTAASSLWLMVLVQLTPAGDRPFVDGSYGSNNIFTMVFSYNFTSRFGSLGSSGSTSSGGGGFGGGGTDYGKLFGADFGSQIGWLYPLALIALAVGLLARRGTGRTDTQRAGYLMWAGTLLVTGLAFSAGTVPHSQYMAVLAPGLAALSAAGIVRLHRAFVDGEATGWLLLVAIGATVAWATHLSYENTTLLSWLPPLVIALGLVSIGLLAAYRVRRVGALAAAGTVVGVAAMLATPAAWALSTFSTQYDGTSINAAAGPYSGQFGTSATTGGGGGFGGGTTGGGPGGAGGFPGTGNSRTGSGSATDSDGTGGFPGGAGGFPGGSSSSGTGETGSGSTGNGFPGGGSAPSAPTTGGTGGTALGGGGGAGGSSSLSSTQQSLLSYLREHQGSAKYLMAVMSSGDAEDYIADAGASVLPVGGFSGDNGYPSLTAFKALIASGELKYVLISSTGSAGGRGQGMGGTSGTDSTSEISSWVTSNCKAVSSSAYGSSSTGSVGTLYACTSS
ncbi:glycosyltransferase family 39 protein [Actinospica durhamensis]|uniref:Glycosyltransferase family 39 protein n=1 Tax=Actinospica durhamensis TaxID=1508375 RepID=A0A941ETT2_9ACTN|nr:glycosyltransferase family 39 protein [Actinospica durhamensis]MBR7837505.1 glycosyltransferase family 39 protein [Actinospica durhamensis]